MVRMKARGWVMGVTLAITALTAGSAFAYCPTTTCAQNKPPKVCVTPPTGQCQTVGNIVTWPTKCASFSVQVDGSVKQNIAAADVEQLLRLCLDNWQDADCGNSQHPNIKVDTFPQVECSEVRYNSDAPNQNVWMFRDSNWVDDYHSADMIALTSVHFDKVSGDIYDADEEFNSEMYKFSLETVAGSAYVDLQSVIQHESGHFLGLAHSFVTSATMYSGYNGGPAMRTLDPDDMQGICSMYPPESTPNSSCDTTPRHGFSKLCYAPQPNNGGCSIAQTSSASGRGWVAALGALLGAALLGRRYRPLLTLHSHY